MKEAALRAASTQGGGRLRHPPPCVDSFMDECVAVAVAEAVAVAVTEAVAEAEAQKITTTTTPGTLGDGPPGRPPGSGSGYFLDSERQASRTTRTHYGTRKT